MYELAWLVEGRVVLFRNIGDQTSESVSASAEEMFQMFEEGISPVHVITDLRFVGKYPSDLSSLKNTFRVHENSGNVTFVGGHTASKFISSMLVQLTSKVKPAHHDTLEDAIHYLKKLDVSLPEDVAFQEYPDEQELI